MRACYPAQCVACGALVDDDWALCAACWREAGFLQGLVCDACGVALPGEDVGGPAHCDACLGAPPPWGRGRAAMPYKGLARGLVLRLKHGDRPDLARPLGLWLARAAAPLVLPGQVLVPVPLHWTRLLARRYNQAALLAHAAGRALGLPVIPDALARPRRTASLGHLSAAQRRAAVDAAIVPRRALSGPVLLIDDVLTSGATLAAATEAAKRAGATDVRVLVVARTGREEEADSPAPALWSSSWG